VTVTLKVEAERKNDPPRIKTGGEWITDNIAVTLIACHQITLLATDTPVNYPDCISVCFSQSQSSFNPQVPFSFFFQN
jgi:hypothetical protein